MGRWLVTQNDAQFAVDNLDELRTLARTGKVDAGDMVQPPGATDWLYASEIPELKGVLGQDDELDEPARSGNGFLIAMVALGLVAVLAVAGVAAVVLGGLVVTSEPAVVGEGHLAYSEMLVTRDRAPLLAEPVATAATVTTLRKDTTLSLLAKRDAFYRARTPDGQEGWIAIDAVLPMYLLGGGDVKAEMDPLYNPDSYVDVGNASWMQIDKKNSQLTVFRFQLDNSSMYPMTDLVLLATIKDSKGAELERIEIPVEGEIPPNGSTLVGTFRPEDSAEGPVRLLTDYTFTEMASEDPDLILLYSDGVEVEMKTADFTEATIDLLEVRAVPPEG